MVMRFSSELACLIKEQGMSLKNKNLIMKEGPRFTHFVSLPLIDPHYRASIQQAQSLIRSTLGTHPKCQDPDSLREHHHNQCHVTLFKLVLRQSSVRQRMVELVEKHQPLIRESLEGMVLQLGPVSYFTRYHKNEKNKELTVLYAEIDEPSRQRLNRIIDLLLRELLKEEIVVPSELKGMNVAYDHNTNLYRPETLHISLFRARGLFEDQDLLQRWGEVRQKVQGFKAEVRYLDVSTMGKEYDETDFYLPLSRIYLSGNEAREHKPELSMKQGEDEPEGREEKQLPEQQAERLGSQVRVQEQSG